MLQPMQPKKEPSLSHRWIFISVVIAVTLILDQLTKIWARSSLVGQPRQTFLFETIAIEHAENTGAFLSVGSQMSDYARFLIFTVGVVFVLIWAAYLLTRRIDLHRAEVWGLALLLAGGIGNLIDRVMKSSVTDFVQIGIGPLRTGIFNVADVAIMLGVGLLFLASFLTKKKVS